MKRKLHLHRETLRHLATSDLSGAQGGAAGRPTANVQSCVIVCPTAAVSCNGTCQYSQCPNLCQVAGTNPCIIPIPITE